MDELSDILAKGMAEMSLAGSSTQQKLLIDYIRLLSKWNRVYNLTAIRDLSAMVSHHLLDSLSVLPFLSGSRVVDVGAGAGLPGIPLAIMRPDTSFVELEKVNKKARFMQQATLELGIQNVQVECQRAEQFTRRFDTVISRAFASLSDMLRVSAHLCEPGGSILAMKGKLTQAELDGIPEGFKCVGLEKLKVPGLEAERHLVHISPLR